jgi:hypothetical protein
LDDIAHAMEIMKEYGNAWYILQQPWRCVAQNESLGSAKHDKTTKAEEKQQHVVVPSSE